MTKRLLDCTASELSRFTSRELLGSIAGCEGRVLACETIGVTPPLLGDVTNAEYAAALSADILLLNMFDVQAPVLQALPETAPQDTVRELKRLTGRVIAVNLEPVDPDVADAANGGTLWQMTPGRMATAENARLAAEMGVSMVLLTGNPGNGVCNDALLSSLRDIKREVGERLILAAGKMHASGVPGEGGSQILTETDIDAFADAGADIILMPAPGTVPGITLETAHALIEHAHRRGCLAMTAIGTSQEGADVETVRRIAHGAAAEHPCVFHCHPRRTAYLPEDGHFHQSLNHLQTACETPSGQAGLNPDCFPKRNVQRGSRRDRTCPARIHRMRMWMRGASSRNPIDVISLNVNLAKLRGAEISCLPPKGLQRPIQAPSRRPHGCF